MSLFMNWYNVLMKGVRDYSDKKNTVYLVDEFKNDIVFSRSCFFKARSGLSVNVTKYLFRKLNKLLLKKKLLSLRFVILELGKLPTTRSILLWHYRPFSYVFILWSSFWMIWWFRGVVIDMNSILTCAFRCRSVCTVRWLEIIMG